MQKKAVSNVIADLFLILLALITFFAVTTMYYSGFFSILQNKQLEQFLSYREEENLLTLQNQSFIVVKNVWDHITRLTYLLGISSSGVVNITSLNIKLLPGQSYAFPYKKGYSYAFITAYGNEFWASYVNNPTLNKYTLTMEVNAPVGGTTPAVGTYFYPFGSRVEISAKPNTGYYFVDWQGSGYGSASGYSNPAYVYMWSNITERAVFGVKITFNVNSLTGADPNDIVLYINGTPYQLQNLPAVLEVPYGSILYYSFVSPVSGSSSGVRFVWENTTGLASAQSGSIRATQSGQVIGNYIEQYKFKISAVPSSEGTTSPSPGTYWEAPGAQLQIRAIPNAGITFLNWTGSGAGSYSGTNAYRVITINSPINETAYFESKFVRITFNATGISGVQVPKNIMLIINYNGSTYNVTYFQMPFTITASIKSELMFSFLNSVYYNSSVRYLWQSTSGLSNSQSGSINVTQGGSVIAKYQLQYKLTINVSPSGAGSTNPAVGSHWYDEGAKVTISASANSGYEFVQWSGSGTGSYFGKSNPAKITISGPINETADFNIEISFLVRGMNSSAEGTVLTLQYGGSTYNYNYSQFPVNLYLPYGSAVSFSFASPVLSSGSYAFVWVSTSGYVTRQSGSFTVPSTPESETGNYEIRNVYIFKEQGLPPGIAWNLTVNGYTYNETAPSELTLLTALTSLSWQAYNISYKSETYVPVTCSGIAYPGTVIIRYTAYIPANGTSVEVIQGIKFEPLSKLCKLMISMLESLLRFFMVRYRNTIFINNLFLKQI